MSFSSEVKKEIASHDLPKNCCAVAAAYAIACFGKYFDVHGTVLHTEYVAVAQYAQKVMHRAGIEGKIYVKEREDKNIYEFAVKDEKEVEKLLSLFGKKNDDIALHINGEIFVCDKCVNAFISAAFLCVGTMTNPEKDYNLEFLSSRHGLINDFAALLQGREITTGYTCRKGYNVLYIKSSEQIEDLLTIMGATNSALEIMNLKVYKNIRNKANRIANCETANIDKTVTANVQTLAAIEYLHMADAFEALPQNLRNTAELLEANPNESLRSLVKLSNPAVSKSGLSHRLKKLEQIANSMKERANNG